MFDIQNAKLDQREPRGGWAAGGYSCTCIQCKCSYYGDKRSWECADCAYELTRGIHVDKMAYGTVELLPCPFCGKRLKRSDKSSPIRDDYSHPTLIDGEDICMMQYARVVHYLDRSEPRVSVNRWNRRAYFLTVTGVKNGE